MGASHLRFVLASVEGQILEESRERVHSEAGPRGVIAQIREGIARLIQSKNGLGTVRGIAIGVPGGVDPQTGKVVDANNVPGWREEDMGRELEETFQIPVFLEMTPTWPRLANIGVEWHAAPRISCSSRSGLESGRAFSPMAESVAGATALRESSSE